MRLSEVEQTQGTGQRVIWETGELPNVAEALRSATFLGRVSRKQSRCQLSNDPKGSAKECGPRLEALGRHKSLPSEGTT